MDMNSKGSMTDEELEIEIECENAHKAFSDFKRTGSTNRRCLKCGGQFQFYEAGNSYEVWCENNDFKDSVRGI
jgi:hypothetical protein